MAGKVSKLLIHLRENVLDFVLGINQSDLLNNAPVAGPQPAHPLQAAEEMKRAVNHFKALAMDEAGSTVDYALLAHSQAYEKYRRECTPLLKIFDPASLKTRNERTAFWINVYNALIVDAVIHYKVQASVTEGFLGVFRFFRKAAYLINGHRISAEDIEHGILRANRGNIAIPGPHFATGDPRLAWVLDEVDPRIHFALNCASRSCPPINVYTGDKLDQQLDLAAGNFLSQEVQPDNQTSTVYLSRLLGWYQADFGGRSGLLDWLYQHKHQFTQPLPARADIRIKYTPYNWKLNT